MLLKHRPADCQCGVLENVLAHESQLLLRRLPVRFLPELGIDFIVLRACHLYGVEVLRITLQFDVIAWRYE